MRHSLIIISVLFISTTLFSQVTKKKGVRSVWTDTMFALVQLKNSAQKGKVVAVDIGKKATIFLSLSDLSIEAKTYLSNDLHDKSYEAMTNYFDSASLKTDTIILYNYYDPQYLEYLISHLLIKGDAKVFYKKQNVFVDTIFHRLERYGGNADRFFYLPDKRPFYVVQEYSGILDNDNDIGKGHLDAYLKEVEKLQSLRKE